MTQRQSTRIWTALIYTPPLTPCSRRHKGPGTVEAYDQSLSVSCTDRHPLNKAQPVVVGVADPAVYPVWFDLAVSYISHHGVECETKTRRETPEDAERNDEFASQQKVLWLRPARPNLCQYDCGLLRMYLMFWHPVSLKLSSDLSLDMAHTIKRFVPVSATYGSGVAKTAS